MKVKELIDMLQQMPADHDVIVFAKFKYGGEISEVESICENGPSVQLNIRVEAFDNAGQEGER